MGVCVGKIFDWLATVCVRLFACWQVVPDSDAHRAGLQEGDQVLSVNDVDFQDIEHSRVRPSCDCTKQFHTVLFFCHICRGFDPSLYECIFTFQAVDILKTAREILMKVRFFPYSKSFMMVNFYICSALTVSSD